MNKISLENMNSLELQNQDLSYQRELISIPASGTIELIYKYRVHAHPNIDKSYPYKKAIYYTFRELHGWMRKIYSLGKVINLNPVDMKFIDNLAIDEEVKYRLKEYISIRSRTYKFSYDGQYKFYILGEEINLLKPVKLPRQNNHAYFTIAEMYSGKEVVERCNKNSEIDYQYISKIIEKNSPIDYFEIDNQEIFKEELFLEGDKLYKIIEGKKRNSRIRKLKLENFKLRKGKVYCEVCGIDDIIVLDVHHDKVKVSDMKEHHATRLNDLKIVCANCHRKLHRLNITVNELIELNSGKL